MDRQNEIVSLLRAINENLPEGGGGTTYEAGQNIDITDNKISAKGYFYNEESKEELKLIDDILQEAGMPAGESLGLKVSGAAGATTYTWTDEMGNMFAMIVQMGMLPGVGATYQTANGKSGVIASIGDGIITFEETLDADNALTNEPVDYVVYATQLFSFVEGIYDYIEFTLPEAASLSLSGAAGATTYTGSGNYWLIRKSEILKLQNGKSGKIKSYDESNHTVTFEETLDADNALVDEPVISKMSKNNATGLYSHVEGGVAAGTILLSNTASGMGSHAEGGGSIASGLMSHAEGAQTVAKGEESHAEGSGATASGMGSHAEGGSTTASGNFSHAEGENATASGHYSHAEGRGTSPGKYSHAEGLDTTTSGDYSHAEGNHTTTNNYAEHAEGQYNVSHTTGTPSARDEGNTQHSIGVGKYNAYMNAVEIMKNGDMYVYGLGGYQGTNTKVQDNTIKTLQEYIASLEARIAALEGS